MGKAPHLAVLLSLIMAIPGCTSFSDPSPTEPTISSCEEMPTAPGCFEEVVTVDDCKPDQVFNGNFCRSMLRPELLSFGESEVTLVVGSEMQALTPSFLGDAPSTWSVNPQLPDGISLDPESGVISGKPTAKSPSKTYTIIASNFAGVASESIDFQVLPIAVQSIWYSSGVLHCTLGEFCNQTPPFVEGGLPNTWSSEPPLPLGLSFSENGSIFGTPVSIGDSNHTITAKNEGGSATVAIRVMTIRPPPEALYFDSSEFTLSIGEQTSIMPFVSGGQVEIWAVSPELPSGLEMGPMGAISGSPTEVHGPTAYTITATNSGGSVQATLIIEVIDLSVFNLHYPQDTFDLSQGDEVGPVQPSWSGGAPTSWSVSPPLPDGFTLDITSGSISGTALALQDWSSHTVSASNKAGSDSTIVNFRIVSLPPESLSWDGVEFALASSEPASIAPEYQGPSIESWEVSPPLPQGLQINQSGVISGTPYSRTDWSEYTVWANNSGGSVSSTIWIAVHDLAADQNELLSGMGETSWNGWPSPILPIGEWSFPLAYAEGGYTSRIPVISASHVGKGRMVGYGHESWVSGGSGQTEEDFSLKVVEWVCGPEADVGLAYGAGFDGFKDELEADGHVVHLSVTPENLSGLDCLLDEFWNGHDDEDNENIISFLMDGGGVVMGGHAWYWSYSNSDLAHNYPGNKIAQETGLFVSDAWGYNDVDMSEIPHPLERPRAAIDAIMDDRIGGIQLSAEEATIVDSTLSTCTSVVSLDFIDFWSPLRDVVNETGWTVIEYGTLWEDVGYNLGEDPVADTLLRVETALTQGLPADELPAHPSHSQFPGEVPPNASRVSESVSIDGNQSGLHPFFGYSSARAHLRMTTGLYAAPGDVVTVSIPDHVVDSGTYILVGAHSDSLWGKDQLHRHPEITRWWYVDENVLEVGNAFGGPIYVAIEAGSILGNFEVVISNAVEAPTYRHGDTTLSDWLGNERVKPAPWAEIGSDQFILTVPSHEIRELENPDELMDWWDQALLMEHEIYGFPDWPRVERAVFDAQISAGWMHSGYPFMAHDLSVEGVVNVSQMSQEGDWGMFHELGHNHQWMPSTLPGTTETGCNFASVYLMEDLVGVSGHGAISPDQRELRMRNYFEDGSNIDNWSVWVALDTFLLVKEEWTWSPITEALSVYYEIPDSEAPSTGEEKFNAWVLHLSNSSGFNLAPYHAAWGFPLDQSTFDALDHLPIWVDDPLRGDFFEYQAILRELYSPSISEANSNTISWETYDNGTNITLTIFYGTSDGGNQPSSWSDSIVFGSTEVGNESQLITGLTCCGTTYHARIRAANDAGEVWFGPLSWTTDYLPD